MFNRSKCRYCLWLLLSVFAVILCIWFANAANFADRLSDIWLNISSFSNKSSISRYEISRLLTAANCEDCVHAPDWMKQRYTKDFWSNFKNIDGEDFDDIDYEAAVRNKNSYYYCVAYVWDNGYMGWYPSSSTKCPWKFCGQEAITTSEFYQTILNIIQDQIRSRYRINWLDVKSWMKWLKKNSIQMKVLKQVDIDAINNANPESNSAQTNEEFQAWLKYCMYNLSACDFQSFGTIGAGYWPVSELNILYKEGIISIDDAKATASFPYLEWEDAIRIFSAVYDNYSNCSFNVDYDCDGIVNWKDNCPYMYNPNQYDLDWDGMGNVCDQDVDWDWKKNPVWIVDDNNNVVVSLWDDWLDKTPLGDGDLWFSFFINVDAIGTGFPTAVRFSPLTNGNIAKIERNFWDWTKQVLENGGKVNHIFQTPGNFTVSAIATSKDGSKAFAMSKIFIANPSAEEYMLNLSASALFKNWNVEYTITPLYAGNLDTIKWSVNDWNVVTQKVNESFKTNIKEDGLYIVNAKWYVNWNLKAVAMLSIVKDWTPAFASMNLRVGSLWDKTSVITNLVWVDNSDVGRININWWPAFTYSNNLSQSFVYEDAWIQTIQQSVLLKNGVVLNSMATVSIQNSLLKQSYAVNIQWNRLVYNQNEKLSLWLDVYPKSPVLSLFTSYQAGYKNFIYNPDLSKTVLDFSYLTAWDKILTNSVDVNRCVALTNQWTIHINSVDVCLSALKNWKLSQYKCDMDSDGIPDICDDDIDGDGIKNLIWIVTHENKDCSIGLSNVNGSLLRQQFWICSLDNCPFDSNSTQTDLDNDWVGDVCVSEMIGLVWWYYGDSSELSNSLLSDDLDQDGVVDSLDACVDVPWNSSDGCPDYYTRNCRERSSCGNNVVDPWETCLTCPQDVWVCCGNGVFDYWESCKTCPGDSGECSLCGNKKVDDWENCRNCPEDMWKCTAICWNGEIEDAEDCMNCPKDVWECTASCGNEIVEKWEDCKNCPEDVKMCRSSTCGDGKVDELAWEECDNQKDKDWNDVECTKMCTIYDSRKPLCWNGQIDEWEDCKNCSVDLWEKCVKLWNNSNEKCGNKEVDEWENCMNCSGDVWECSASCGNNEIEAAEDCENCPEDVKMCRGNTCGDGVLDELAWEKCDNWKDKNGKDWKCTKMCTIYDSKKPLCWNGQIDKWEDCKNCPVDLWNRCVNLWNNSNINCGNKEVDDGENCKNCSGDVWKCSASCGNNEIEEAEDCRNCPEDVKMCRSNTCGDGVLDELAWEKCDNWKDINGKDWECTKMCTLYDSSKPNCWNGKIDKWEDCKNCPVDLWNRCVKSWNNLNKKCGNKEVDEWENCKNCPGDVWKCSASCGNNEIEEAEDCRNCPKDVKMCRSNTCGDGVVDELAWEKCDNWKDKNGRDWKCTKMCTLYDPSKPNCWNGRIDKWETCKTCPVDLWNRCIKSWNNTDEKCGNDEIDEWENCMNCPEDVWKCSASCGNDKIEDAEDCRNCPKDVWECTASCGNKKVEKGEDCQNCPEDVKMCRSKTCGNGKVDLLAWEECDGTKDKNWNVVVCTKMCIIYDSSKPNCWNGEIDKWETCKTCPVDLWEKCVKSWNKAEKKCGNKEVDEWENCKNCPEDVWKCTASCGNKKIEAAEDCRNCPKDVWECSASCGNGIVEKWEDCENCSKDVKVCRSKTCGNGKVDELAWEECDSQKDKEWNDVECTKMCTIYDSSKPNCWNGERDEWEDCENCPVDLWEKCIYWWNRASIDCWNGERDEWEECDPKDISENGWWSDWCSNTCKQIDKNSWKCNPDYDWKFLELVNDSNLCLTWTFMDYNYNPIKLRWTWSCKNEETGIFMECVATRPYCWNGNVDKWETCENCPQDLKERCIDGCDAEFAQFPLEKCPDGAICSYTKCEGTIRYKIDKCQSDYRLEDGGCVCDKFENGIEACTPWCPCADLNDCPEELKKQCKNLCWNGELDNWETCETCSQDLKEICVDICAENFENFPLRECLDWAICSYMECGGMIRYNIDKCQSGYKLDDGECVCNKFENGIEACTPWCPCADLNDCPEELRKKCDIEDEYCNCETCPEKLKERCITDPAPVVVVYEEEDEEDDDEWNWWSVTNDSCNSCPCEYVDFSTDLVKWDSIRAKLWDKSLSAFYRYSNSVAVDSLLDNDEKWSSWTSNGSNQGNTSGSNKGNRNNKAQKNTKPIVSKNGEKIDREYLIDFDEEGRSLDENLDIRAQFKNLVWFNNSANYKSGVLYLDSTLFVRGLNFIKDEPAFIITITPVDKKEYQLTVRNKVNNEKVNAVILQESNPDFEVYCLDILDVDLYSMLWFKLSEVHKWKKIEITDKKIGILCNFTSKEAEKGCIYKSDEWCSKDGITYYKTPCSACDVGYTMKDGQCVANVCGEEYWLNESYTSHYEGTTEQIMHGWAQYIIDMIPNCQHMEGCERPAQNDNARFGGLKYHLYEGWVYYACTKCDDGYELIKGHCIAKSGIGSIYKRNGKPIGVVFYEDDKVIKVVSFYNVNVDSKEIPIAATDYFYSDSTNPVLSSDDRLMLYEKLANAWMTRDNVRVNWNDGKNSVDIKALKKITSQEEAKKDMDGFSNTVKILAEQPNFQAAKACYNYEPEACKGDAVCGKGKWYLPALWELWQLCLNYKKAGPVLQALNLFDVESSDIGPLSSTMNGNNIMVEGVVKNYSIWGLDIEFGCSDTWIEKQGGKITTSPQTIDREREKGVRPVLTINKKWK